MKLRQDVKRRTPQARGWYRSSQPRRSSSMGILGNPAGNGMPGRRKKGVSIRRAGTFLGLCALGAGIATLAGNPPQSFEEQVVSMEKRILGMPGEELAPYDGALAGLVEAGYMRLRPETQSETMGSLMEVTRPEARYEVSLVGYQSLGSEEQYTLLVEEISELDPALQAPLLEDAAGTLALPERTELADTMLIGLPEYARQELLMRHSSELIGGLYHNAIDSAREGISGLLDSLLGRDKKDAQQDGGERR